ncbi:MAG: ABC transporter permease [Lachnospiraceae bacterium]|nr:ABC transporter permease [Lachnospiraceae bacterium]
MIFLTRAFLSVIRNFRKSCIFFFLVLILASVISTTIFINQAVTDTWLHLQRNLPPIATVKLDIEAWERFNDETGMIHDINLRTDLIHKIAALPYVKEFDYFSSGIFYNPHLIPYKDSAVNKNTSLDVAFLEKFWLVQGVQNPNLLDIQEERIELVYGRTFTVTEMNHLSMVILISETVAHLNYLTIGSTVQLRNIVFDNMDGENRIFAEESYTMEVIGIFRPVSGEKNGENLQVLENRIYAPNHFVELAQIFQNEQQQNLNESGDMMNIQGANLSLENRFVLYDSQQFLPFKVAVEEKIPPQFRVVDIENAFVDVYSALMTMDGMTNIILWVTVGISILFLSLLITLFLRDRRREIGIYFTLGEKKHRITIQICAEVIIIAILAIITALFVGFFISSILSEHILRSNILVEQSIHSFHELPFYGLSFHGSVIFMFLGVGVGTILLASIIPVMYVLGLNPKKIMM